MLAFGDEQKIKSTNLDLLISSIQAIPGIGISLFFIKHFFYIFEFFILYCFIIILNKRKVRIIMLERYKELLANSLLLLSQKVKKDYDSDAFVEILKEDIGFDEEEIEDIIETMDELS